MKTTKVTWYHPDERLPTDGVRIIAVATARDPSLTRVGKKEGDLWYLGNMTFRTSRVLAWAYAPKYDDEGQL